MIRVSEPVTPSKRKGEAPDEATEVVRVGDDTGLVSSEYELAPGTRLGEYAIEGPLGGGGMGDVFAAVHPTIGTRAAINVLKKELCNPFNVERFIDEARVVNAIGHPNIVDIFAFGEMPDGRRYFVMELLVGQTLRQRIAQGPMPPDDVCAILKPLVRALDAAHAKGVIHRDLKPDNVFLQDVPGERPRVKLLDFGIAKLAKSDHRIEQTRSGVMVGTPQYVAPEQAKGHTVDARADIYTLGGIAFEMLTGRPPFEADNAMELVAKHLMEPPVKPSSVLRTVPPELDSLVVAMLAKDPASRPALVDVAVVIEHIKFGPLRLDDAQTSPRPDRPAPQQLTPTPVPQRVMTPAPNLLLPPQPRALTPQPVAAVAPSSLLAAEPASGAHTAVEQAVDTTTQRAVTRAAPSRTKWIVLSLLLVVSAAVLSYALIASLKGGEREAKADAAIAAATPDAPAPVITEIEVDAAQPAVAIDAGVAAVDAADIVVDAARVIADAATAPIDARAYVPPPPPPRTGTLVIAVEGAPAKDITILIGGKTVSRGRARLEIETTLGKVYKIEVRAPGRLPERYEITADKPRKAQAVKLLELMEPGGK